MLQDQRLLLLLHNEPYKVLWMKISALTFKEYNEPMGSKAIDYIYINVSTITVQT